jgi:pyruvate dehydrogenase E2 component (dihydrolipoamide acetyltransferase)
MSIFNLPDLGEGLSEAEILAWHVSEGDVVAREQLLLSVETAKAVVEIPAPQSGRVVKLFAHAGDVVPTGAALVEFATEESATTGSSTPAPGHVQTAPEDAGSVVGHLPHQATETSASFVIGRHRHTEGRLQQQSQQRLPRQRQQDTQAAQHIYREQFEGEALHGLRRHMADTMSEAHRSVALVTIYDEVEVHWHGSKRPVLQLLQALCHACGKEPALNAWYDGERKLRQLHQHVNIAVAMDTRAGLVAPVLKQMDTLDEQTLGRRLHKLKVAAVKRTLGLEDLQDATITLSVFGSIGARFATPLVTPPQVAILGAGEIHEALLPDKKHGFRKASLLPLSLSFDHRAVTGGEALRFLKAVMHHLQG